MPQHIDLRAAVSVYEQPIPAVSLLQLVSSIAMFLGSCALMYWSLHLSYFVTLLLAIPTGALLVRVFIIQHDCGHRSFFKAGWANDLTGEICSIFTMTPYTHWRRQHAGHHVNWNNLDMRCSGSDLYSTCLTVKEYHTLSPRRRFLYRLFRHPVIAHLLLPPLIFLVLYRVPFDTPQGWSAERRAVYLLDFFLLVLACGFGSRVGYMPIVLVQFPVMVVASIIGVWLFAVQHRFENSLWARQPQWAFTSAALDGSSYLKLPRVLQWITGNIGYHNVHHFATRIPNYRLESCYTNVAAFRENLPMSFRRAMRSVRLALWDEDRQCLVPFKHALSSASGD